MRQVSALVLLPASATVLTQMTRRPPWRQRALDNARSRVSRMTRRFGFDVARFDRGKLLAHHRITTVFDVGANVGQYAAELRAMGYEGRIISFEPLAAAFHKLERKAATDADWVALHLALGETDDVRTINVSANSQSSSLLEMLPRHVTVTPHAQYQSTEETRVAQLDSIFDDHVRHDDRVFVKLDVQGYERFVLAGATQSLPRIQGIQLEMSLVPLYRGEANYLELIRDLAAGGFQLMAIEPVLRDPSSGQLLAIDGVFFRT